MLETSLYVRRHTILDVLNFELNVLSIEFSFWECMLVAEGLIIHSFIAASPRLCNVSK